MKRSLHGVILDLFFQGCVHKDKTLKLQISSKFKSYFLGFPTSPTLDLSATFLPGTVKKKLNVFYHFMDTRYLNFTKEKVLSTDIEKLYFLLLKKNGKNLMSKNGTCYFKVMNAPPYHHISRWSDLMYS